MIYLRFVVSRVSSAFDDVHYQTSPQQNTPFQNPIRENVTEIEVTDPTHPLFGRRFPVLSITSTPTAVGHIFVAYRGHIVLRIPLLATNLVPPRPRGQSKLTFAAVIELLAVAAECEVLCPSIHLNAGYDSPQSAVPRSSPKSAALCRR